MLGLTRVPHSASVMSSTRRTETPGEVHLDQRLLDRALPPPVALDDRRLEGLPPQLRHLQADLAGPGLQRSFVAASPRVLPRLAALVASGAAQPVRLGVEHGVQRLLDRPADHLAEVIPDPTPRRSGSPDPSASPLASRPFSAPLSYPERSRLARQMCERLCTLSAGMTTTRPPRINKRPSVIPEPRAEPARRQPMPRSHATIPGW